MLLAALLSVLAAAGTASAGAHRMERYNVVWTSPSKDASGVMPVGNGDIAAGVYAIENGDLYLLLAKNDAYTYQGDIFKTGRVRISLDPSPFRQGKPFRQVLDLPTGSILIEADGVKLRIWADAHRLLYHVEITAPVETTVTARPEFWKRFDRCGFNAGGYASGGAAPGKEPPQDVRCERNGRILWHFTVGDRSVYLDDLKAYQIEHMASHFPDPFRFNTFGNLLECPSLALKDGALRGMGKAFDIRIHALTMQTPKAETWIGAIERQAAQPVDAARDWERHCAWWANFWERSWIVATDRTVPAEEREKLDGEPTAAGIREESDGAALAAQSYNVFRFLMACQSRGRVQAKFNGGLFTQQLRLKGGKTGKSPRPGAVEQPDGTWLTHEDDRLWGRRFTFQNQRLLYWPLLASCDFDLMKPFFDYYWNLLPMRTAITKAWFGHDGAYYRENIEPTGAERDCEHGILPPKTKPGERYGGWYHDYYFTSGLETLAMMLDYASYTGDEGFRDHILVPFAREVLLFFDQHYPRGADRKLRLEPAQVLETWWVAINPAPDVAGLRFCLDALLAIKAGTAEDKARWRKLRDEIPDVPMRTIEGHQAIAPAAKWERKSNAENGELYPVFPFRCFGSGLGTGEVVAWTMKHRSCKDAFGCKCWTQDQIHWAYAGRAAEARDGLVRRFRAASPMCRFPLYGAEGPDSCPDFDHFGAGAVALQRMLVQEAGSKLLLLSAWPADWDTDFRLHAPGGAVLTGTVKDGKLLAWDIVPADRKSDVVVCQPQATAASAAIPKVIGSWLDPKVGDTLPARTDGFAGPVSFEVWLQPGENEAGRILDKLTPGQSDGFLLDAWPKLSLRLIVGPQQHDFPGVLKPGAWHHVAVVIDRGLLRVYLDGQPLRHGG